MTRQKDQKRLVRSRMQKTGEAYTTARAHILSKAQPRPRPAPPRELAALAGTSDRTIAAKTGRTWQEWVRVLDVDGAAAWPHRHISALLHTKYGVADWWAQTVTVGYERIKGLRVHGQRRDGGYEVGKSRTFGVPVALLFEAWASDATRRVWLDGLDTRVRTATASKSMRLQWPDGTIVAVWFSAKGEQKSAVAVAHTILRDKGAADDAKRVWADRLDALASLLGGSRSGSPRADRTVQHAGSWQGMTPTLTPPLRSEVPGCRTM